jgi:glycosyltransferase involved in cell wall biosynthesis
MATRSLHIAWLGPAPGEDGGVPGVACDLLDGLARLGHRIDCFFPSSGQPIPARLQGNENISFTWGTSEWRWDRWYSGTKIMAFASGLVSRGIASVRLRGLIHARHERDPYDVIYQFSSIESPAVPPRLTRTVPLVIHPETHAAGELRSMIAERHLAVRCGSPWRFGAIISIMAVRTLTQALRIRRAALLVCISGVFRDHMVRDYRFPSRRTVVVPNPVRLARFEVSGPTLGERPTVLVLGRIAARKGLDDVVAVARLLRDRAVPVQIRIVGGPSLWSDYTPLLDDLPPETAEYAGAVPPAEVPAEIASSALLLQASKYEPFALTIGEALASGVPVVGTTQVGAIESVDRTVAAAVPPGDPEAMASAITEMLEREAEDPAATGAAARSEAERLFAPAVVCEQVSAALLALTAQEGRDRAPAPVS